MAVRRRSKQLSFSDYRMRTGRGGPRPGAGRPRGPRPSLRSGALVREWKRALAEASEREGFRVTHYSLQGDHAHLIVEAKGKKALAAGMKSIGTRLARALNRVSGRSGAVLDGRRHPGSTRRARRAGSTAGDRRSPATFRRLAAVPRWPVRAPGCFASAGAAAPRSDLVQRHRGLHGADGGRRGGGAARSGATPEPAPATGGAPSRQDRGRERRRAWWRCSRAGSTPWRARWPRRRVSAPTRS